MPLIAPARRDWTGDRVVILPDEAPFALSCWPPKGWRNHTADSRLLLWEAAATSLAFGHTAGSLDREDILDSYNFLALPGTANPALRSTGHHIRYFNFKCLCDIALGKVTDVDLAARTLSQLEAARAASVIDPTCNEILKRLRRQTSPENL